MHLGLKPYTPRLIVKFIMNVSTNFLHYLFRLRVEAILALSIILSGSNFADQKLKVFILAGQSNTVGHARGHTIATLYKNGMTKDKVDENAVSIAQRKAAHYPEFRGNALSVESYKDYSNFSHSIFEKGWPLHYHEWSTVGSDRPYH